MRWFQRFSLMAAVAGWVGGLHASTTAQPAASTPPSPAPAAVAQRPEAKAPLANEAERPAVPGPTAEGEAGNTSEPEPAKPASPYQAIIARNAFGLKTPPPPPAQPEPPAAQVTPSALKLTAVFTMLGNRSAMFVLQEPGKPQLNSELVKEGEKDSVITNLEVLTIDERAGAVRVVYGGKELTLDFVNNGLKPPAAPAPVPGAVAAPGTPAAAARPVTVAGVPAPGAMVPGTHPAGMAIPAGAGTPGVYQPGGFQPGGNTMIANPTISSPSGYNNPSGLQSIPTRPTRLPFGSSGTGVSTGVGTAVNQGPQNVIPPDQQALLMRAQEEISRRQGVAFPPSPPIPGVDDAPPPLPPQ